MPQTWTTSDFDDLCWHDCRIHGFRMGKFDSECGTAEIEFDLDFIVEWHCEDGTCRSRNAPATLTFYDVFGLRIEIDYVVPTAGMTPFSIDGIYRESVSYSTDKPYFCWRLPINWPSGEITFQSSGFSQVMRPEPIETEEQS